MKPQILSTPKLYQMFLLPLHTLTDKALLFRCGYYSGHQLKDQLVEASLPANNQETIGLDPMPKDPIEAFAFVGTRCAHRATKDLIDAVRQVGYRDLEILDLAIAVATANMRARIY
jgi:hypothetical protein